MTKSNLMKCPDCGAEISTSAKACPKCGSKNLKDTKAGAMLASMSEGERKFTNASALILGIILLVVALVSCRACGNVMFPDRDNMGEPIQR